MQRLWTILHTVSKETVSILHRTRLGHSQKPLPPLKCRKCTHSLVWLTTMPSFSHTSPVCWPCCTHCSKRVLDGHGAQKKTAKSSLTSPSVLAHYNPAKKLFLDCYASLYGVGAVLSHKMEDGLPAQQNRFSNRVWVKKFHHYLFGKLFTIFSNHKPLQHLFSASGPILQLASAWIQSWACNSECWRNFMLETPGWFRESYCLQCSLMARDWRRDRGQGSWVFWVPGESESTGYCVNVPLGMASLTMGSYPHWLYAGPFLGKMFLIVVNAHSTWMEVEIASAPTSAHTVEKVRAMFTTHGLSKLLVSDNGTAFTSAEFQKFLSRNEVRHLTSAPYHLSSNGLAERAVKTFKSNMQKGLDEDVQKQL